MHVTLWWCSRLTIIHDRLGAIWWWELQLNYANAMYCSFKIKVWLMKYNLLKRMTQNSYTSLMLKQLNGTNISWEALSEKNRCKSTCFIEYCISVYKIVILQIWLLFTKLSVLLNIVINSGNKRDQFRNLRLEGKNNNKNYYIRCLTSR